MKLFKWFEGTERADEGGADRWQAIESRIKQIEDRLTEMGDLPVQWATTTTQLRRLVGHVTKTAALDTHRPPEPPPAAPRPLTQDEVIHRMNNGGVA